MKSFAKLIIAALAVTICVALGSGLAGWLEIPKMLAPLLLLPAAFVFARFDRNQLDWLKLVLFLLLLGVSIWVAEILLPTPFNERYLFVGPALLMFFIPSLERLFDRVRPKLWPGKPSHQDPDCIESK